MSSGVISEKGISGTFLSWVVSSIIHAALSLCCLLLAHRLFHYSYSESEVGVQLFKFVFSLFMNCLFCRFLSFFYIFLIFLLVR
jgi:phosphate/sulfate permease